MSLEGFKAYNRRKFCNDIKSTAQTKRACSERIRQTCGTHYKHITWQFHRWLIEKGYLNLQTKK